MIGIDDAKLRDVLDDQLALGIGAGDALTGVRIFDVAKAVPDQTADIQFVVQDAHATSPVAVDRARSSSLARWSGYAVGIELVGNAL